MFDSIEEYVSFIGSAVSWVIDFGAGEGGSATKLILNILVWFDLSFDQVGNPRWVDEGGLLDMALWALSLHYHLKGISTFFYSTE